MVIPLAVNSEIGRLQTVLLHRPGQEIEHVTPQYLERLLFDDIPHLPFMQKEHDQFAVLLRQMGVEVLYLEELLVETLATPELRQAFVQDVVAESGLSPFYQVVDDLKTYLLSLPVRQMVRKAMGGVCKHELRTEKVHLGQFLDSTYPFYLDPLPNLYFTRDPATVIGDGVTVNSMCRRARKRESLFIHYILSYHPRFSHAKIPRWYDRQELFALEGGDILVLNERVVAIGISDRTAPQAIEKMALQLFRHSSHVEKVVAIEIPKRRAFMHLDTVLTMVDLDQFIIHPAIIEPYRTMRIFLLEPTKEEPYLQITPKEDLQRVLQEALELSEINFIPCGGHDPILSAREQWNDGANTLAVAPAVVITYDRNLISNQLLREAGIKVLEVNSSELGRGRGGPRCMSMPLVRAPL